MNHELTTESRNPIANQIDELPTLELVRLINDEDAKIASAVRTQDTLIARAIDEIVDRMKTGGRLLYIGAGTSGRLGVLDASECPPTFNTNPEMVVGIIAGGPDALVKSAEGAEDVPGLAEKDLMKHSICDADVLIGIATSGRTPYVVEALKLARSKGCFTVAISCNANSVLDQVAELAITPVVGPEVVSGSTRMKAGTATKMVLNMLTTGAMVRSGKTFGDLMVDLRATNDKLRRRAVRIVQTLTELDDSEAQNLLANCDGEVKTAIVMHRTQCTAQEARDKLASADGFLRRIIQSE